MLTAIEGTVKNNRIVVDDPMISRYEGSPVIVTILESPRKAAAGLSAADALASDSLVIRTPLANDADSYIKELRAHDRF